MIRYSIMHILDSCLVTDSAQCSIYARGSLTRVLPHCTSAAGSEECSNARANSSAVLEEVKLLRLMLKKCNISDCRDQLIQDCQAPRGMLREAN